jgi:plasmid stability protein
MTAWRWFVANVWLFLQLDETVHSALLRRAGREQATAEDVVAMILRRALAAEIEEAAGVPSLADLIQGVVRHTGRV